MKGEHGGHLRQKKQGEPKFGLGKNKCSGEQNQFNVGVENGSRWQHVGDKIKEI